MLLGENDVLVERQQLFLQSNTRSTFKQKLNVNSFRRNLVEDIHVHMVAFLQPQFLSSNKPCFS